MIEGTATGPSLEPVYAGVPSFLRRPYTRDFAGADVVVTGIPLDLATSNRPGARFGPRALREASAQLAWNRPSHWEVDPFTALRIVDGGDCDFDFSNPEVIPARIERHAAQIIAQGPALLSLGGDHFVSYPLLKAHAAKHGPLSLLHFDAHYDTWNDSEGRLNHGSMFWFAVEEGLVDPRRSAQIGMRTQIDDTLGFHVFDNRFVHERGACEVAMRVREIVGDRPCYLSFDIDCLDPAFAPGTGTPVVGGISTWQAQCLLRELAGINVVGMDVVEVAPAYDHAEITALAGASLALDLLCLYASR